LSGGFSHHLLSYSYLQGGKSKQNGKKEKEKENVSWLKEKFSL